jgi:hypothetical protein
MKFTKNQLIQFAQSLGVPHVEVVDNDSDADYKQDDAIALVHANQKDILRPQLEAELKPALEEAAKGKHTGEMYSVLARATGMSRSDLEKIVDEGTGKKDINLAAKHAVEQIKSTYGKDTAGLQQQIETLIAQHNKNVEELTKTKDAEINTAKQRYIDRDILNYLHDELVSKTPMPPTADKMFWSNELKRQLQDIYHVTYDEAKKTVDLFDKTNTNVPALNAAGNAKVLPAEIWRDISTRAGIVQQDMRQQRPDPNAGQSRQQQANQPTQTFGTRGKRLTAEKIVEHLSK